MMQSANPISSKERSLILDALRGLALLGICLANYPEFSLYTFQDEATRSAMPTYGIDRVVRFMQYFLIDGKFYTIFSLLFGIGFSIILANAQRKHANGLTVFYRRMAVLAVIGAIHLMLIWSGDILLLYALLGMVLPLFLKWSDKRLLPLALLLVITPTAIDTYVWISGANLSAYAIAWQKHFCGIYGITDDNFGVWLRDADNYGKVLQFLVQGACVRVQEMTDGHRAFKVMALFLVGYYIGRNRVYARLEERKQWLERICKWCALTGVPASLLYAWSSTTGRPLGLAFHSLLYTISVVPMALTYVTWFCILYIRHKEWYVWKMLAAPGRMALTNYIGQSLAGMMIFYGTGLGLGAGMGLVATETVALAIFTLEALACVFWLRYFQYGPLEWIWRMLVYGKTLKLRKQ